MLFHVTMTHTVEDCPGYNLDKMPGVIAATENLDEVAKQAKVKVHYYVSAAPAHLEYALLEAESNAEIMGFMMAIPWRQDFEITPVMHTSDLIETAKSMIPR